MSDRLKSTNNISNEDVIDDLTKNLELSLRSGDQQNVVNPDSSAEGLEACANDADIPLSEDETEKDSKFEESDQESDTESLDEVTLKDAAMVLTDDQKEERKAIAEYLKNMGNDHFNKGEYEKSIVKYTEAIKICPLQFTDLRAILYGNRSAAKIKLEKYKKAIQDCNKALDIDDKYLKAYYRRAQCYEALEKLDESLADFKKILERDPTHKEALSGVTRLPPLIEERNEKLKKEMFGKLKDLGNMILKPFGLSTENFQMEQDAESKGYKINFKQ